MNTMRSGLFVLALALIGVAFASCNKPKKSSSSPAPTTAAQEAECIARGDNYRWEGNQCVPIKSEQELCMERAGYTWQNNQCIATNLTPEQQCTQNGGQWVNGVCVGGNNINQLNGCQNTGTVMGSMDCIQVRTNELEAYLRTRGDVSSWYNNVERDIDTIRETNVKLKQASIQSASNLSWFQKQKTCWDLRTLSNQKSQIAGKLKLSGSGELDRAEPYLNNLSSSVEQTKQLIGCNSVLY